MTPADDLTAAAATAKAASDERDTDLLAINTIRTLAIDAVREGQVRPRRRADGLAPVAYTLWTRFLRYDPAEPAWPNRDRFVLSAGHASMLLYALLHLAGVERLDRTGASWAIRRSASTTSSSSASWTASAPAIRNTAIPPASRPPPGRSARACGNSVGMAIAERWLAARFNRPGRDAVRLQRLRPLQRRRHDGGRRRRGGLDRRPPEALQPLLDLRRQQRHHRGPHRAGLQRRRGRALPRPMAGRPLEVADANDCEAVARAIETLPGRPTTGRP